MDDTNNDIDGQQWGSRWNCEHILMMIVINDYEGDEEDADGGRGADCDDGEDV